MSDDDAPYPIDPRIWESDLLTGVYYRFRWSDFEPNRPGEYDWTDFDAAMDACVAANKLCAIGWKAGFKGTPQWLFDDRNPDKIPGLKFPGTSKYALGSCAEPTYIERWNSFIAAAGERTRTRADWFRAVSYHKVAGINKWSAEAVYPWQDDDPERQLQYLETWATTGKYTPEAMYDFWRQTLPVAAAAFPGKAQSYQLIQGGYPRINNEGQWYGEPGVPNSAVPGFSEQTTNVINAGPKLLGHLWTVQHNGLQKERAGTTCPNKDHIDPDFPYVGSGCPNKWAQAAYLDNDSPIGYQTVNDLGWSNVGSALENMIGNSYGMFFETYQGFLIPNLDGRQVGPRGNLGDYNAGLHQRRSELFDGVLPEPFPSSWSHTFTFNSPGIGGLERIFYTNGRNHDARGVIVIRPPSTTSPTSGRLRRRRPGA
jgi:hypothetical protein